MIRTTRKKIHQWEEAGLISSEQASDLHFYEHSRRNFTLMATQVAVGFILLGILAISASSWGGVSTGVRVGVELGLILAGGAYALRSFRRERMRHFEVAMALVLALSLGFLISLDYWYQTTGEPYWMLGLWALITAPAILYIRGALILLAWSLLALAGLYGAALDWTSASDVATINVILVSPFFMGVLALFGPKHMKRILFLEAIVVFAFNLFSLSFTHVIQPRESLWVFLPVALSFAFWFSLRALKPQGIGESLAWLAVMGAYSGLIVINFGYMHTDGLPIRFIAVMLTIGGFVTAGFIAYMKRSHQLARLFLLAGVARALFLYYEALGGQLFTGFGLILTGVLILGTILTGRKGYRWFNQSA